LKGIFIRIGWDWRLREKILYLFVYFLTGRARIFVLSECFGEETQF